MSCYQSMTQHFFPFVEVFRTCKTLLVGGLSIKILVKAAFYGESMKIGGEGYLDLLNRFRRDAHRTNLLGTPRGPQSTPEGLRGKKFCFWKGGPNDSECFDLPRSTIVKNTFLEKKTLKFFILVDFDAKMVNIADLEYSADANSGMRQVKCFITAHTSPSWPAELI